MDSDDKERKASRPSTLHLQALFTPEHKFADQKFRYNLKTWPVDAIHIDRIATACTELEQRIFVGRVVVYLHVNASPKPRRVNIMNAQCLFSGLPSIDALSSSSSSASTSTQFALAVPDYGLPFDLSQGVFQPRSTCVADDKALSAAVAECGQGHGETWLCVGVRPSDSLADSLLVYLRLELKSSQ